MGRNCSALLGLALLVVESEPSLRELLIEVLEGEGAQIRVLSGVREWLDSVGTYRVDCLLCNVSLMDGDGYMLMNYLRQLEISHHRPQIPAIAIFNSARIANSQLALESGFQAVITHPLQVQEVIDTVLRLAGRPRFSGQ